MKKVLFTFIPTILFLVYAGCSNDSGSGGTDPFHTGGGGGGGGGTGNVTFTVDLAQDNQQQLYFEFKPSTNVVITQVTANCAAAGVNNETVTDNSGDIYSPTSPLYVGPITVAQTGQQWTFNIQGKIGSTTGQAFNVNANFTVP